METKPLITLKSTVLWSQSIRDLDGGHQIKWMAMSICWCQVPGSLLQTGDLTSSSQSPMKYTQHVSILQIRSQKYQGGCALAQLLDLSMAGKAGAKWVLCTQRGD